jgi:plastocyanin
MQMRIGTRVPVYVPTLGLVTLFVCTLVLGGCGTSTTTNAAPTATTAPAPTNTVPAATNTPSGPQAAVSITSGSSGFAFSPASMTIKAGTTVTWTNKTGAPHTVTSDSGDPASFNGSVGGGATFSFTFTTPGTYQYHCNIHPYMAATITVTA